MAEWAENKLYAKWLEAEPADRGDIEAKLYAAVKRHAQAVLWNKLDEAPDDLVASVAEAVITQLPKFQGKSKFSTWVQGIAQRKTKQYIRGKVRARKVFDEYTAVVESTAAGESEDENSLDRRIGVITPSVSPQVEGEIAVKQFRESLSKEDATLLQHKEQGLASKDIAERTGSTVEAVDSRWARLKPWARNIRLKPKARKIRSRRRK